MRRSFFAIVCILFVLSLAIVASAANSASAATNPAAGYLDQPFDNSSTGVRDDPTADKPQSKLWYNDGSWWAVLDEKNSNTNPSNKWHIFKLNWPSTWVDTGVVVDDRPLSRADCLWDNVNKKLYIASTKSNVNGADNSNEGRLYRYSYANGTYTLDTNPNFPVVMFIGSVESTTIDKDTTGQLWVTYTKGSKVYVNRSLKDGNGVPNDASWNPSSEFVTNTKDKTCSGPTCLNSDDISSLVAYKSNIGLLWSNHNSPSSMYFTYHKDGDPDTTWQPIETIYTDTCAADDHINLKSIQADSQGRVFAALKTSYGDTGCGNTGSDPLLRLVVRKADKTWAVTTFGTVSQAHTRPVVLLDTDNSRVYMFATSPTSCGIIYMKSTSMDNPDFSSQIGTKGTEFINTKTSSNDSSCANNATSTKQTVNNASGLVVVASDKTKAVYAHNVIELGSSPATNTPTATKTPTTVPGTTATATSSGIEDNDV